MSHNDRSSPFNLSSEAQCEKQWQALQASSHYFDQKTIASLFADDPDRQANWCFSAAELTVDLSRQLIDDSVLNTLIALAEAAALPSKIKALLDGDPVNTTEQRAAHHTALRLPPEMQSDPEVGKTMQKIAAISKQLREGSWRGCNDHAITDVVNIGIGGSDLGPRMATHALAAYQNRQPNVHFVANIDPRDLELTLRDLNPQNTLVIVSSKSFNTTETLENALSARKWLLNEVEEAQLNRHLIAVSSNVEKAVAFGVDADNILPMWDWVGGRYSLWSAIGLPIAIAIGFDEFSELLAGAHAMDRHFSTASLRKNAPVLLALLEIWYVNVGQAQSVAVLPYAHELRQFPDYLQQLTMESNGKRVQKNGATVPRRSCPTVWGSAGTIGQHSFHQLLHQGTELIPTDFILPLHSHSDDRDKQIHLVANCLAQSKAMAEGKSQQQALQELTQRTSNVDEAAALAPHKTVPGNRPNSLIVMDRITPFNLGSLIALYEHKVYVQSVIWDINAFDQWGVELGKQLADPIYTALNSEDNSEQESLDQTTDYWVKAFRSL